MSVPDTKQLVLFLLVPLVFEFARGARARTLVSMALTVGAASALVGIVQYGVLNYGGLGRRPQGTLSHWMTYSGTLMLVICAGVSRLLFDTRDRAWAVGGDAGARHEPGPDADAQRLGRRVRRRRHALPAQGPPARRPAADCRGRRRGRWPRPR